MKHKFSAAACACMLAACSLTGCGAAGESSDDGMNLEQYPYGSTLVEDTSRSMTISYDKRFLDDALVEKIYTYYHSLESKDGEAFGSVMFPLYHDYQLHTLYEDSMTDQDLAEGTHDNIKEYFGYDFDYAFIDVTNVVTKLGESSGRDSLELMLDQLAEEKKQKPVSDDTQHLYEMTITRYIDKKGSGTKTQTNDSMSDETLYAIQYQNEWYLMYS